MTLKSFENDLRKKKKHTDNEIELAISVPGIWPVLKKRIHGFEHKAA